MQCGVATVRRKTVRRATVRRATVRRETVRVRVRVRVRVGVRFSPNASVFEPGPAAKKTLSELSLA